MSTLTQSDWERIYPMIERERRQKMKDFVDLAAFLTEHDFSLDIRNIDFSRTIFLSNLGIWNIKFTSCNFAEVDFKQSCLYQIQVTSCQFIKASLSYALIQDSSFHHCDFSETWLASASFSSVSVFDSVFTQSCWNNSVVDGIFISRSRFVESEFINSSWENCIFRDCDLSYSSWNSSVLDCLFIFRGKLLETNFLAKSVRDCIFLDSDLTDCLLLDLKESFIIKGEGEKPHSMTRPIVAITWDFRLSGRYSPLMVEALRDNGLIPLKIERTPMWVDVEKLDQEVRESISAIQKLPTENILSIPAELLTRSLPESEIKKFSRIARSILIYCSGLALPGGADIQPEFYGAVKELDTESEIDYRRSVLEFALLSNAHELEIPIMGTCRGAQMINVYLGGTLRQSISDIHHGGKLQEVRLSDSSRRKEISELINGDSILVITSHHQAADKIGVGLEVILECQGIPKLLLTHDDLFIACQVHPECYLTDNRVENGKVLYRFFLEVIHRFSRMNTCVGK